MDERIEGLKDQAVFRFKRRAMDSKNNGQFFLKGIKFSLILKLIIIVWSFYIAIRSETLSVSIIYLVVSIVFVGLFIYQLNYYRTKTKEQKKK